MRHTRRIVVVLVCLLPVANAAAQEQEDADFFFIQPEVLLTASTVVIETDMRLGTENAGQEHRIKNEVERMLGRWGRYEVVEDPELADLTITLVTNDQVSFFQGIYEPLQQLARVHKLLFVVAANGEAEHIAWADGTTETLTTRQIGGGAPRRIAARFVNALRERVESEEQ